jgi:S-formylglutathione hydrolase
MNFSLYIPPKAVDADVDVKLPVLYWLSGLTCTEQNFIIKSGFQRYAAENNLIVVGPDTSPRGVNIEGEDGSWDFGSGAGFYVNSTQEKWKEHYRMYSYVVDELPALVESSFSFVLPGKRAISGHSMGGHGALICGLKNPGVYSSVSAFAPIVNPSNCPWGQKAFSGYLGEEKKLWSEWDATELVRGYNGPPLNLLIDQGSSDEWLAKELKTQNFVEACAAAKVPVILRMQDGYDHGYFFVGTFLSDHFKHHAAALQT